MSSRGTDAIPLAPRPSLAYYRKLSKDLLAALQSGNPAALHEWATGFIERLACQQGDTRTPEYVDRRQVDNEVRAILRDAERAGLIRDGGKAQLATAQYFVGGLHGFESWPRLVSHLTEFGEDASPVSRFEAAADAIVTGDLATLRRLVTEDPGLIRSRSTRDHHGTLLHYSAANGHEGFRQRTPKNAVEVARLLLESGAAPDAQADMYGHRCTTMQMLVSSVHPFKAGVQEALVHLLVDFGAAVDGPEKNSSPIMTALRFHYPRAAEALAARGARIDLIIPAAALGRADLVELMIGEHGALRPEAMVPPGPWPRLPADSRVQLGYALTWAAMFGRAEVVELMLRKGVPADGSDDDASALHCAAAAGRLDLVGLLLRHGASLETLNSYGGTVLDGTLWHAFNAPREGVDYAAVVRDLIDAGARTDCYPEMAQYVEQVLGGRRGGGYPDEEKP